MIRNEAGEKCTPKDKAKEILIDCFHSTVDQWLESHTEEIDALTERELDMLEVQLTKLSNRVFKMLGIEEIVHPDGTVEKI